MARAFSGIPSFFTSGKTATFTGARRGCSRRTVRCFTGARRGCSRRTVRCCGLPFSSGASSSSYASQRKARAARSTPPDGSMTYGMKRYGNPALASSAAFRAAFLSPP